MVLGLPTAPAPATTDDADRLELSQLHLRERDRPLIPAEGRQPYTHLGMTLVLDEFDQPGLSVQADADNFENDEDQRRVRVHPPMHAARLAGPARVVAYALNQWNGCRLALALLHSAAQPALVQAVFARGCWKPHLVHVLVHAVWRDNGDGFSVMMLTPEASCLTALMVILLGQNDAGAGYLHDIDAMGIHVYGHGRGIEERHLDSERDMAAHIMSFGFERVVTATDAPLPAPHLAPCRYARQADRRLRRALEAYAMEVNYILPDRG